MGGVAASGGRSEGVGVNLSELIDTHRGGRSYAELARDCGGRPTDKRLQQLVRQDIKNFPDPPTVQALARGLRVSESAVVLAAAESLGLDVRMAAPRLFQLLPAGSDELTEEQAAAVAQLVRAILNDPRRTTDPVGKVEAPREEPTVAQVQLAQEYERAAEAIKNDPEAIEEWLKTPGLTPIDVARRRGLTVHFAQLEPRQAARSGRSIGREKRKAFDVAGEESQDWEAKVSPQIRELAQELRGSSEDDQVDDEAADRDPVRGE